MYLLNNMMALALQKALLVCYVGQNHTNCQYRSTDMYM